MKKNQPQQFKKNQLYRCVITGMTGEGNGVCKIDGYTVFVPDTAIGDECELRLVKCNNSYAFGRLEKLFIPSPDRIDPECTAFRQCGGCIFQHIQYQAELVYKTELVRDAFSRLGGLDVLIRPIIGSERILGYRNKAQYPVGIDRDGRVISGFYARRSHRIVECEQCSLQPELFAKVQKSILAFLQEKQIPIYQERDGSGLVRHIYLRYGEATNELMVCIVATEKKLPYTAELIQQLTAEFPVLKSLILNVNRANTNVILGDKCITLWGSDTITDVLCGVKVKLSPLSFYQVNRPQAEQLYQTTIRYAALTGQETLLDLYCGAGTIGLAAASHVRELIGVEIVPAAVENAKENAAANQIQNARFLCADAGKAAKQLAAEGTRPDVIIVDPPRKGLDEAVIDAIVEMSPARLVMVSCNPATAARDAALLAEKGYASVEVTPLDLFPRTGHVECVVLMPRVDKQ